MTQTEKILHNFLLISLGGTLLMSTACTRKQTDGSYCIEVAKEAECPSVESVNQSDMPYKESCSTTTYLEVTELRDRTDGPMYNEWGGYDTATEDTVDTCCYTATYRDRLGQPDCVIGRPFMQEQEAVVASLHRKKGDWDRNHSTIVLGTEKERQFAGNFYLQVARYEHASVASFNRFALELMKHGAPAHLVHQAQTAAMDEIRHAQSSFSIANELLGEQVQPGEMKMDVTLAPDLKTLARTVLEEAAIQETLAVLIAAEQLRIVESPMIKKYLEEVVREESRHSELAFATLRWCVQQGGEEIVRLIAQRLEQPITMDILSYPEQEMANLGLPSRESLQKIVNKGIGQVIIPSLKSLIADVDTHA